MPFSFAVSISDACPCGGAFIVTGEECVLAVQGDRPGDIGEFLAEPGLGRDTGALLLCRSASLRSGALPRMSASMA